MFGRDWNKNKLFLSWAEPLQIKYSTKIECAGDIKRRIADPADSILLCSLVAAVKLPDKNKPAYIVWALIKRKTRSRLGHDCTCGIIYLDENRRIMPDENDHAVNCRYSMEIEDPSFTPRTVFRIKRTGDIGIVYDNHGAECWNRSVIQQEGKFFNIVHRIAGECFVDDRTDEVTVRKFLGDK